MPDNTEKTSSGIRVLAPDDEDARAVARAMASNTAGDILKSFQGQELTVSEIAVALDLPIPTIMYHFEALLEAGLIEVSRITYSVKGREVKKYRQSDRVFIVTARHTDLKAVLLKYASLFGITLFCAALIPALLQLQEHYQYSVDYSAKSLGDTGTIAAIAHSSNEGGVDVLSREIASPTLSLPFESLGNSNFMGISDIGIGIFIGGFIVIGMLGCIELINYKRKNP